VHWQNACGKAVEELNNVGLQTYTSATGKAVRDWYILFCKHRKFPNPLLEMNTGGPPFLLAHPESVKRLKELGYSNLEKMTCDFILDWLRNIEIPRVVQEHNDTNGDNQSVEEYL
jgi:hypothetical protein